VKGFPSRKVCSPGVCTNCAPMTREVLWRKDRPGGCLAASGKFEALRTVCEERDEERDGERERRQRAEEEVAELQGVARG